MHRPLNSAIAGRPKDVEAASKGVEKESRNGGVLLEIEVPPNKIAVGVAWFASSALFSTYANTAFLREFQSPVGHTFVRFAGATLLSGFALGPAQSAALLRRAFLPYAGVGCLLFLANYTNSIALGLTGITMTYTVKAALPVFTVALCALGLGQKFPPAVYASLVPTVVGVALASASDASFNVAGLAAALLSCAAQTGLNVSGKRVAEATGVVGFSAFFLMAAAATLLSGPLFALAPESSNPPVFGRAFAAATGAEGGSGESAWRPLLLLLGAAAAYQAEYALNFVFVALVDPVTFSVCDIVRRLAVIVTGAVVFNKPLSTLNVAGIALALGGVLAYSFAQQSSSRPLPQSKTKRAE